MSIRPVTAVVILVGLMSLVASVRASPQTTVSPQGQTRGTPPPLVITATAGTPVDYKAPRTPWDDPDLQGVWSSDDMEGVPDGAPGDRDGTESGRRRVCGATGIGRARRDPARYQR